MSPHFLSVQSNCWKVNDPLLLLINAWGILELSRPLDVPNATVSFQTPDLPENFT